MPDYANPDIESSYRENDLGRTLYDLVLEHKPTTVIEFGTLNGYSAVCIGLALKKLGHGALISYDLWDEYKFKKGNKAHVEEVLVKYGVEDFVALKQGNFDTWVPEPFDLMHVDISNDGSVLTRLQKKTVGMGGLVLFEGGSPQRDRCEWMLKYNKQPMQSCGVRYEVINEDFPSLSKLI